MKELKPQFSIPFSDAKLLASKMNLKLHAKKMKNVHDALEWECKKKHKFKKSYYHMKRFYGNNKENIMACPSCEEHFRINELVLNGKKHKHKLIFTKGQTYNGKWKNGKEVLYNWRCANGHNIKVSSQGVKDPSKRGCPECIDKNLFNSIKKIKNWLEKFEPSMSIVKGEMYRGNQKKIKLLCSMCNEVSEKRPSQIKLKKIKLCNFCSSNTYELIVLQYLKKIIGGKWEYRTKPFNWLVNEKGNKMEIDGYNAKLKLGFEHHGLQHYQVGYLTKTQKDLEKSKARDKKKEKLCYENGIKLIVIKELFTLTPLEELTKEILNQCNGVLTNNYGGFYKKNCKTKIKINFDNKKKIKLHAIFSSLVNENWKHAIKISASNGFTIKNKKRPGPILKVVCKYCNKESERKLWDFVKSRNKCRCNKSGLNFMDQKLMETFYKKIAKKYNAKFISCVSNKYGRKDLEFKCLKCSSNTSLIQPRHSVFKIDSGSFFNRLQKPYSDMLINAKDFHPGCGRFSFKDLTLKEIQDHIKTLEPTAKIFDSNGDVLNEKTFISNRYKEYLFECGNKKHDKPYRFKKQLREIKKKFCKSCGIFNSNRTKESYLRKDRRAT